MEKRYVIYSRKSRDTGRGESVENQVEMCRNYLTLQAGPRAAAEAAVYEDEGYSGGNLDRPRFQQMMADSRREPFAAIVVYRLDRISRNIGDFAGLIQDLGDRGIGFISIREQFDTASPMGRAMMYIASVFSQLERETIAQRIRDNMHQLAKTGRWLGGVTPLGYASRGVTRVTVEGKRKSAYELEAVPGEIRLVQEIFDKFLELGSLTGVDRFLLEGGYTTRRGKAFTRFAIKGILSNPVYMAADEDAYAYLQAGGVELCADREAFDGSAGILAYNRTLQRPGKTNRINPMSDWIVALGTHPGAVSGRQWVQAQELLARNRDRGYRSPRRNQALLSGLLVCSRCGAFLRPRLSGRQDADGTERFTYRCTTRDRSGGTVCSMDSVDGNLLDGLVLKQIWGLEWDRPAFLAVLAQEKAALLAKKSGDGETVSQLRAQRKAVQADMDSLLNLLPRYSNTDMEQHLTEQITRLHRKQQALETRLAAEISGPKESPMPPAEGFLQMDKCLSTCSPEQQRTAVRRAVEKILWDGETARILWRQG